MLRSRKNNRNCFSSSLLFARLFAFCFQLLKQHCDLTKDVLLIIKVRAGIAVCSGVCLPGKHRVQVWTQFPPDSIGKLSNLALQVLHLLVETPAEPVSPVFRRIDARIDLAMSTGELRWWVTSISPTA